MSSLLKFLGLVSLLVVSTRAACNNPTVSSDSYSTGEVLMSSKSIFITEITVNCDGSDSLVLSALVGDELIAVARSTEGNQYQVSWKEDHEMSFGGKRSIKFFDEEGTATIKKIMRNNEELNVEPLFSVNMDHRGAKSGLWIAPSFIAMVIALLVWWLAYTTKTKIQD